MTDYVLEARGGGGASFRSATGCASQLRGKHGPLQTVMIVYEDRGRWIDEALDRGFTRDGAEAAACWLLGHREIEHTVADLREAMPEVDFQLHSLENFLADLASFMQGGDRTPLLWNITDGQAGFRGSLLTSFATMTGTPFFGCPPFAQAMGQDKFKLYSMCRDIGIRCPSSALVEDDRAMSVLKDVGVAASYFVKPNSGGNKVGIGKGSRCSTLRDAMERAHAVGAALHDRIIVQQFIEGPEVRITFIDTGLDDEPPRFGFDLIDDDGGAFITAEERDTKYEAFHNFLEWDGMDAGRRLAAAQEMRDAIVNFSKHVRLKDYFTFDFRLDAAGKPHLIDFNPGAFLYGDDVEGYTVRAFNMSLPGAILSAMSRARAGVTHPMFASRDKLFRL